MKILIMGLPGSGKTTLARKLQKILRSKWINADQVRKKYQDWSFDKESRLRQAKRMGKLADKLSKKKKYVIADFICPTKKTRTLFKPDFVIWMNTIKKGRFADTNEMFVKPKKSFVDIEVKQKNSDLYKLIIIDKIKPYKWKKNKKNNVLIVNKKIKSKKDFIKKFENKIIKYGQTKIYISKKNLEKKLISNLLTNFKNRYKLIVKSF